MFLCFVPNHKNPSTDHLLTEPYLAISCQFMGKSTYFYLSDYSKNIKIHLALGLAKCRQKFGSPKQVMMHCSGE